MAVNLSFYRELTETLSQHNVVLVAVSKIKPVSDIRTLYDAGQRDFGENYVQELLEKQSQLPEDVHWHFIGHLQSNKVKYIVPFIYMIHGVDSVKLLREIEKQAAKLQREVNVLLQVHIATEETKFGFDAAELEECLNSELVQQLKWVKVRGLMGMASFSDDMQQVGSEMEMLSALAQRYQGLFTLFPGASRPILSMGMSGDYLLAIEKGSNMVRIGSSLFGARV